MWSCCASRLTILHVQGEWAPRQIDNPDFFVVDDAYSSLTPIVAVGTLAFKCAAVHLLDKICLQDSSSGPLLMVLPLTTFSSPTRRAMLPRLLTSTGDPSRFHYNPPCIAPVRIDCDVAAGRRQNIRTQRKGVARPRPGLLVCGVLSQYDDVHHCRDTSTISLKLQTRRRTCMLSTWPSSPFPSSS